MPRSGSCARFTTGIPDCLIKFSSSVKLDTYCYVIDTYMINFHEKNNQENNNHDLKQTLHFSITYD